LSLEQVDELYGVVSKAWKSRSFTPTVHFSELDHQNARSRSLADIAADQERKRSLQHDGGIGTDGVTATEKV
jgi:hypothetical protein